MISKIYILLLLILSLYSCNDFLDINHDPNNPEEVSVEKVLPAAISSVAYVYGGKLQVLGGLWSQHYTQSPGASQYAGIDAYDISGNDFDGQFGQLYSEALSNLEFVRLNAVKNEEWNVNLMVTAMQCFTWQLLVDLYDEIPYIEALRVEEGYVQPHYDSGQLIYDSLIVRLKRALNNDFDLEASESLKRADILFGGNMNAWERFSNNLLLKIYLRECYARPQISESGIRELYENNKEKFLNQDAAVAIYSNSSSNMNPFYGSEVYSFGSNYNLILSRTLHSFLVENSDYERLAVLYNVPEQGGGYESLVQGGFNDSKLASGINSSSYSKPAVDASDPVFLISYSESCFQLAEAILRYQLDSWDVANTFFKNGLTANYARYGLVPSNILLNEKYVLPADGQPFETQLKAIILQKWVGMTNTQAIEAFIEHSRTGYPEESNTTAESGDYIPGTFTISMENVTSGKYPKRLILPQSEQATNPNTPQIQPVYKKIWWDKKESIQ